MERARARALVLGALSAVAAWACGGDGGPPGSRDAGACVSGRTSCSGACVLLSEDPTNCGSCGRICPVGETCVGGDCDPVIACLGGELDCGGQCIDVSSSEQHCGRCAHPCDADERCMDGICVSSTCTGGTERCGVACVDTDQDKANCGTCGRACNPGEACVGGNCMSECGAFETRCTISIDGEDVSYCSDLSTDARNCGTCGRTCSGGRDCIASDCRCETETIDCDGVCTNTDTSLRHCGRCDNPCGSNEECRGGFCECAGGLTRCGSACVNPDLANEHCGTCFHACNTPGETCLGGNCVSACGFGSVDCGGRCVNPETDENHCGYCGNSCEVGSLCLNGTCRPENDLRAYATPLFFADSEIVVVGSTVGASRDGPSVPCSCTSSSGNVWYEFSVFERTVVYFDTAGSQYDTSLFVTDEFGDPVSGNDLFGEPGLCNDDAGCGTVSGFTSNLQSRTAGVFDSGRYYVSVGGCTTGKFTLRVQRMRAEGSYLFRRPLFGAGTTAETSLLGGSQAAGSCGGTTSGEDQRWFITCGGEPQFFSLCPSDGGSWTRESGGASYDAVMYVRTAASGSELVCNDDGATMGGTDCVGTGGDDRQWGSRIAPAFTPRGLSAVFIDSRGSGGSGMRYSLSYAIR